MMDWRTGQSFLDRLCPRHRWQRVLLRIGVGLVVFLLIAWLALEFWLIPRMLPQMRHQLAMEGIHTSQIDPDVNILRGSMIFSDVTFFRTAKKKEPVFFVSDAGIRIDLRQLIFQQTLWGKATVRKGHLILFDQRGNTEFRDIHSDMVLESGSLQIQKLTAVGLGHRINGTGRASWSVAGTEAEEPEEPVEFTGEYPEFGVYFGWMKIVSRLLSCEPNRKPGDLDMHFIWDPSRPMKIRPDGSPVRLPQLEVSGSVAFKEAAWMGLPLDSLEASVVFGDWAVEIEEFNATGYGGQASAGGRFDIASELLELDELTSDVDFRGVLRDLEIDLLDTTLKNLAFLEPPRLTGREIAIDFDDYAKSRIEVECRVPAGLAFRDGSGEFVLAGFETVASYSNPRTLRLDELSASHADLDISGSFGYRLAESGAGGDDPAESESKGRGGKKAAELAKSLNRWFNMETDGVERPSLQLDVFWDESARIPGARAALAPLSLEAKFEGSDFTWGETKAKQLSGAVEISGGELSVPMIVAKGVNGWLEGSAHYRSADRVLRVPRVDSTLDIAAIARNLDLEVTDLFERMTFPRRPHLEIRNFEIDLDDLEEPGEGSVRFVAEEGFSYEEGGESISLSRLDLESSWDETGHFTVDHVDAAIGGLAITASGNLHTRDDPDYEETANEKKIEASDDPAPPISPEQIVSLRKLLEVEASGEPVTATATFEWIEPPDDDSATGKPAEGWKLDAELNGKEFTWLGESFASLSGKIALADSVLRFDPLKVRGGETRIDGNGAYDLAGQELIVDSFDATLGYLLLNEWLKHAGGTEFQFPKPVSLKGKNVVIEFSGDSPGRGQFQVNAPGGFSFSMVGDRQLKFEQVVAPVTISDGVISSSNVRGRLLGGNVSGPLKIAPLEANPWFEADVSVEDAELGQLSKLVDPETEDHKVGVFNFTFKGRGGHDLDSLRGGGQIHLRNEGAEAMFPILDQLTAFLELLIPIGSEDYAWELDISYSVRGGVISTEDLLLRTSGAEAIVEMQVDLIKDHVEIKARVNFRGVMGLATGWLTRMFEVTGSGPISDIEFHSTRLNPKLGKGRSLVPGRADRNR